MAGDTSKGLGWAQFVYTVLVALITAIVGAMTSFYGLRESIRTETRAALDQMRATITEQRKNDLQLYLPLTTYWSWRESTQTKLNAIERSLDRIENRLLR